ncbi:MAG TPA: tripartite tricarboxylate transporter substrate binding protein [Ramlibacter sp.]|nr:tripartite tricarboxylate transporter substrate binding protein [Ramlibacter sp.]
MTPTTPWPQLLRRLLLPATLLACGIAAAQAPYPSRPVRLVVPFPPGGTSDQVARLLAPPLSAALRQPVVVENRPGSSGIPGTQQVAQAPADGHTLGLFPSGHAINGLLQKLSYDARHSFAPIVLIGSVPLVAVISADSPLGSFGELVTQARLAPGKLAYKSGGVGGSDHLATELLARSVGVRMLNVPYKGDPPAAMDLVSNQIDFGLFNVTSVLQLVRAGKLKALGVTSEQRSPVLPEVPTLQEQGVAGYTAGSWHAIFAPAGTPPDVVRTLNEALNAAIARPDIAAQLRELGISVAGGPPERLGLFLDAEIGKWARVIREARIAPER